MAKQEKVKVRILVDTEINGNKCRCNSVAELDAATAKKAVADGVADDNPKAVEAAGK